MGLRTVHSNLLKKLKTIENRKVTFVKLDGEEEEEEEEEEEK
jgi:hypothetical protein